ncbi:MAG: extensin family protein [Variibacter sp.]|nr:extensin family protein [Variibacter sp.]
MRRRMLGAVAALLGLIGGGLDLAGARPAASPRGPSAAPARLTQHVPFPPQRPAETASEPAPSACMGRLSAGLAIAVAQPPIQGPGGCGAQDVVRLDAVWTQGGRRIALHPPAQLRCDMAEAFARWVRDDVAPALAPGEPPLTGLAVAASYDCRGRNNVPGARLSQHGLANALDLRALRLADGSERALTDARVRTALRARLKETACARFTTVLGPESDGYHEEHVHMDLTERRRGYRICQWAVHEAPGERPTLARAAPALTPASVPWPVPVPRKGHGLRVRR